MVLFFSCTVERQFSRVDENWEDVLKFSDFIKTNIYNLFCTKVSYNYILHTIKDKLKIYHKNAIYIIIATYRNS